MDIYIYILTVLKFTLNKYRPMTIMYHFLNFFFVRPCRKSITATYTIFNREHTWVDLKDIQKFRYVKDILTIKLTLNKYRPLTVMYRISFKRPCRKSVTATCTNFNREHAGVTHVNVCEFRSNQRIFTEVIVRTDRQTEVIKTFQL
jgi:hypothetical protein